MPEKKAIPPELEEAVWKTLYHHPRSSPIIVRMLTGRTFDTPPPQPTEEEKQAASETVEELLATYYSAYRAACIEVTGEDPETDWD